MNSNLYILDHNRKNDNSIWLYAWGAWGEDDQPIFPIPLIPIPSIMKGNIGYVQKMHSHNKETTWNIEKIEWFKNFSLTPKEHIVEIYHTPEEFQNNGFPMIKLLRYLLVTWIPERNEEEWSLYVRYPAPSSPIALRYPPLSLHFSFSNLTVATELKLNYG